MASMNVRLARSSEEGFEPSPHRRGVGGRARAEADAAPHRAAAAAAARRDIACRAAVECLEGRRLFAADLHPTADADVEFRDADANYANANFGADLGLRVSGEPAAQNETYVTFDLTSVSSVGSAFLSLTGGLIGEDAPQEVVGVFASNSTTWVEGNGSATPPLNLDNNPANEIRWNNRPGASGQELDRQIVDVLQVYTWNVTNYVQARKAAGATAVSFVLRSVNSGGPVVFDSREAGGTGPALSIEDDADSPVATATSPNVTTAGGASQTVTVTYADAGGINTGTIDVGDLLVTGPGGALTVTGVTNVNSADPTSVVVTYALQPPGGAWDAADNGSYSIAIASGQVLDLNGNPAVGGGAFDVTIAADTTPPAVSAINAPAITAAGGATYAFSVTYTDAGGINLSSIGTADVTVARAGGGPNLTVASAVPSGSGTSVTVTYTLNAPGGTWDGTDNGTYNITVNPNQVFDGAGNAATGGGSFAVAIPVDTVPPTVATLNAPGVTAAGGATYSFTVTYADDVLLNAASIDPTDVTITRQGGGTPLTVTGVMKSGTGSSVTATYTVAAPGGAWDAGDNGTYTISVVAGGVADAAGNPVAAATGSFAVGVPDTDSPGVTISPIPTVTTAGVTVTLVTVVYTDNQGIDATSVDAGDVTAVRDGGAALVVTLVSSTPSGGGTAVEAVYALAAPGGFWNNSDNGGYTVTVAPGAVKDTTGNATPLASAAFTVDILSTTAVADPAFNGGNPISTGFVAEAMTVDAAGHILVAGRQGDRASGQSQSVLQRLNADGSLDTFFGEGGQIIANPGESDGFFAVAMDAKGRIVVAGFKGAEVEVMRFDAKGKADKKFGQAGRAVADWGGSDDTAYAVTVTPDGRVLVAGTSNGNLVIARFTDRGFVDGSFGQSGLRAFKPGADPAAIGALKLLSDGSILAAGTSGASVVLLKFDASGASATTFGTASVLTVDGLGVRTDLPGQDHTVGLAVSADGKILVGNRTTTGDFGVRRYNADGTGDATFGGGDGLATVDFGGADDLDYVGLQGTGQILLAGTTDAGAGTRLAVAALNADGTLDGSFSAGGKFTVESGLVAAGAGGGSAATPVLHANGATAPNGRLLVTVSEANALPTSSPLRQLIAPGSGVVGSFGLVNGKSAKLTFLDGDGSKVTLTLKGGGTGQVLSDGNVFDVVVTGTGPKSALAVASKGGDKRVMIRDLRTDGGLKTLSAKTADAVGVWAVNGDAKIVSLGSLSGTFAAAGSVAALAVARNVSGGYVLAGVALGADAKVGGTGADADGYAAGSIGKLTVAGAVAATYVGAGVNPGTGGTFGDADDRATGGPASALKAVTVKGGVDAGTVFAAGLFGNAKIPGKVIPADDAHFRLLPA